MIENSANVMGQELGQEIGRMAISFFQTLNGYLESVLFYKVLGFPFLVLWLMIAGVFFTIRMRFVSFRLFRHAITVVRGRYFHIHHEGEITHAQALLAAVSATVGLGNIAGVAVAISVGGPGAVIWMVLAGFLAMSTKFTEVTLAMEYREIGPDGKVSGGGFHYLRKGLAEIGYPKIGRILAVIFAISCIIASMGIGNMFQVNQSVTILTHSFSFLKDLEWAISLFFAVTVGIVLIGGIKRIAAVAETIVPFMIVLYVLACLIVLAVNIELIPGAIKLMLQDAISGTAVGGGVIGAIISGFRRAAFSNEAGLGSAPIAHAASKTNEPVREGCVALLEPFIDTVVICFMTGLVISVTGVYKGREGVEGILLTKDAFLTVSSWFPIFLSIAASLFAYSTLVTWSYYGERSWQYLFGNRSLFVFHIIFCTLTFVGGVFDNLSVLIDFSDLAALFMGVPNLVGVYLLSGKVKADLDVYTAKYVS